MVANGGGAITEAAFQELIESYRAMACQIAYKILGHEADAQDAVQDAFLSAHQARHQFKGNSSPTTWLYRIVVNASLQLLRHQRSGLSRGTDPIGDLDLPDAQPGPEDQALNEELKRELRRVLAGLPQQKREAVLLSARGLSTNEVAQVLGTTLAAAKARIHRGRLLVRPRLLARGFPTSRRGCLSDHGTD